MSRVYANFVKHSTRRHEDARTMVKSLYTKDGDYETS